MFWYPATLSGCFDNSNTVSVVSFQSFFLVWGGGGGGGGGETFLAVPGGYSYKYWSCLVMW